jgi:hypothetical protein
MSEEESSERSNTVKGTILKKLIEEQHNKQFSLKYGAVHLTNLGQQFGEVCVLGASTV